ncbi:MAG TPA: hypothetical protein VGM68_00150 [Rhizomicrobium sp.]|jgi:hypothetical protein
MAITLLLLLVGFLFGVSLYQSRGGTFPGIAPAHGGVTPRFQAAQPHP